jgi:glycosyltransferase involved in cell wall biosynthesis
LDVAILGPSHPWRGGIAHHTASLYRALQREGHRPQVFNFAQLYPELFFPGKTQRDESKSAFAVPAPQIYRPLDPLSWARVAKRIYETRPDRLILQWWHPFFAPGYAAVSAAAKLAGAEVVMLCHNVEPHEQTPVDRALLQIAYALPDRFVVQSEVERDKLAARIGERRPITVAAHPRYEAFSQIDADETPVEAKRSYGVSAEHLILFFGLVRPYKGLDLLIDAAAKLDSALDWEVLVAGEIYGSEDDYRQQIAARGLDERVHLENRYVANEEVPRLFRAADVCVLPYRHATGSGVANVALACETPVVMSRLPTLEQAFSDAPVEWFEPGDAEDLCRAIEQVLEQDPSNESTESGSGWKELVDALLFSP